MSKLIASDFNGVAVLWDEVVPLHHKTIPGGREDEGGYEKEEWFQAWLLPLKQQDKPGEKHQPVSYIMAGTSLPPSKYATRDSLWPTLIWNIKQKEFWETQVSLGQMVRIGRDFKVDHKTE